MSLMTTDELRARLLDTTAMTDGALGELMRECEDSITDWAGPLEFDGDDEVQEVTETVYARGRTLARLRQEPLSIVTVTDRSGETDDELDEDDGDFRIYGDGYIERGNAMVWGDRTVVRYIPKNDRSIRRLALVKLVQLELNHQAGVTSVGAGPQTERYSRTYLADRDAIMDMVRSPDVFA